MKTKLVLSIAFTMMLAFAFLPVTHFGASAQEGNGDVRGKKVKLKLEGGKSVDLYDKSYALVIGASEYPKELGWSRLPGVEKDVEEVAVALERHGFEVTKVMNPSVALLEKSFKDFIDQHGGNVENRLVFYFAGHGHTMKQSYGQELGYIIPVDTPHPERDPAGFRSKAMSMKRMELYAEDVQAKHALFLFDSCFSGSVLFEVKRAVPDNISDKTARHVRQFITSGSADETVPDESIFRGQFVAALKGEADLNKDDYVTGSELGMFLQDKVINYSKNRQHPQYGKIRNENLDKGDFVFSLKREVATLIPKNPKPGTVVTGAAGIELVYVPPGSFMMGSEKGEDNEKPVHRVTIREGFWMGKYEVTQAQWQQVMGYNPSTDFEGDNLPVDSVSWNDAQKFIKKLNEAGDGFEYRLPSEAEWEYACRAGTTTEFAFGVWLELDQANFEGQTPYGGPKGVRKTTPVGSFQPNSFGLYDMHGNVWEWCADVWRESYNGAPADGTTWVSGGDATRRVMRGGSWTDNAYVLRSAVRFEFGPLNRYNYVGFRVVAVARQ